MNFIKTIILVIILAIIIGALIVYVPKFLNNSKTTSPVKSASTSTTEIPRSTSSPTLPQIKIDQNTDLKKEVNNIAIPDFKNDFETLKSEVK